MGRKGSRRRRRVPPGPLAPWRFSASVLAAGLLLGRSLFDVSDADLFERTVALGAAFGFVVWYALGVIDRAISTARDRVPNPADGGFDASGGELGAPWPPDRDVAQRR